VTSSAGAGARILGRLRAADGSGVVRIEDRYDTHIDDLWSAFTDPARLARWYGEVGGDLRVGGDLQVRVFSSGWEGGPLAGYGAGVQIHVEDLAAYLGGRERCDSDARMEVLFPAYQALDN
jgi:hypothetical protein